tara:strand:- start:577 stop:783 length:207 start_codon:yes stop_codon:yes gene_type:complete
LGLLECAALEVGDFQQRTASKGVDILTVFSSHSRIACGLYNELYVFKRASLDMSDDLTFVPYTETVFV